MAQESPSELNDESLEFVVTEMRHREGTQDAQMIALSTKSSFLFTAGTAAVGAAAAFVGVLLDRREVDQGRILWPVIVAAVAYVWLVVCFAQSYWARTFQRVPEPQRLMDYIYLPPQEAMDHLTDGRRAAIETNQQTLDDIAGWVTQEQVALLIVIGSLVATLATIALS